MTDPRMPTVTLGDGLKAGKQGLGCMGLSPGWYGENPVPQEQAIAVIRKALAAGASLLSTAHFYGGDTPIPNEIVLGKALQGVDRSSAVIASKWGVIVSKGAPPKVDTSREAGRQVLDQSLARLGVDYLDVWVLRCLGKPKDLEESICTMKAEVQAGRVKHIGVSEMSPKDIRRAHAIHPISYVELEWSLFARDAEAELIPLCRELGIGILAYSPMSRGVLTGSYSTDKLTPGDIRLHDDGTMYSGAQLQSNIKMVEKLKELAAAKGLTAGQLALAWVHNQGDDVVPIPGTKREKYLAENLAAANVKLTPEEMRAIEDAVPHSQVTGLRTRHTGATHNYDDDATPGQH